MWRLSIFRSIVPILIYIPIDTVYMSPLNPWQKEVLRSSNQVSKYIQGFSLVRERGTRELSASLVSSLWKEGLRWHKTVSKSIFFSERLYVFPMRTIFRKHTRGKKVLSNKNNIQEILKRKISINNNYSRCYYLRWRVCVKAWWALLQQPCFSALAGWKH